ncbi:UNVERIFIED_CONTAM: L-ascorbate oxidase, partial [Sesamum latifolium]
VFYFDVGENRRGRFLKISEASVSRNRSTIIVPAGSARDEGWAAFRNILAEINEASGLFILPNQQNSEAPERLVGLSDDVGAGFISSHSSQPAPAADLNVDRTSDLPPTDDIGNLGVSKVIRADQKKFFFDLGSNNRGHFLRISEVTGSDRSSIILPLSGLKQFYEMVGHFVEITKDRIEGMTGANVRTVDPPQRKDLLYNQPRELDAVFYAFLRKFDKKVVTEERRRDRREEFVSKEMNGRGVRERERREELSNKSPTIKTHSCIPKYIKLSCLARRRLSLSFIFFLARNKTQNTEIKQLLLVVWSLEERRAMVFSTRMISALLFLCVSATCVIAGDPTLEHEWKVTYGTIAPLGVPQQGILINGEFPGPAINCTSNNNIVVNVFNQLDEPFLLTWMGIQQRKNSWQDGTPGAMCPILPGKNYTYRFQVKDQIGTYFYFPTTALHRASGGIGMLKVHSRNLIPIPYDKPADEYPVLLGDWYNKGHKSLKTILDSGRSIGRPDGIQINGQSSKVGDANAKPLFTFEAGKTYKLRVCNVGLRLSVKLQNPRPYHEGGRSGGIPHRAE